MMRVGLKWGTVGHSDSEAPFIGFIQLLGPRLATNITISGGGRRAHKPRSKSPCTTSHDFGHENQNSKSTIQDLGALTVLPSNLNLEGTFNHPQPDQQLLEEEQRKILVKSYFEIKKMHEANIEHRSALNLGPIQQHNKVDFYEVGPFGQQILYAFESGWNMLE
ncbi:hypothetical protein E3N88_21973 [Mikania micrantha]|uniref:Uncharacterized protein n=1 Tax=Mikania micrantha TaxID=192012 RepID=A0A5N6N935_9ASTR|nr:hypothetical protein E3N88_21973 [Mikania micrantha]